MESQTNLAHTHTHKVMSFDLNFDPTGYNQDVTTLANLISAVATNLQDQLTNLWNAVQNATANIHVNLSDVLGNGTDAGGQNIQNANAVNCQILDAGDVYAQNALYIRGSIDFLNTPSFLAQSQVDGNEACLRVIINNQNYYIPVFEDTK